MSAEVEHRASRSLAQLPHCEQSLSSCEPQQSAVFATCLFVGDLRLTGVPRSSALEIGKVVVCALEAMWVQARLCAAVTVLLARS